LGEGFHFCKQQLFHGIIAVSVLNFDNLNGTDDPVRSFYYDQALQVFGAKPLNAFDLSSDKVLYTYFILLIYEILAAMQLTIPMWKHHFTQALNVLTMRIQHFGYERLPFLVWSLTILDTYASLSGGGNADLLLGLSERGIMPNPHQIVEEIQRYNMSSATFEDNETLRLFESVLGLAQKVAILAGRLGRLSCQLRSGDAAVRSANELQIHGEKESDRLVFQLKNAWQTIHRDTENMFAMAINKTSRMVSTIEETYQQVSLPVTVIQAGSDIKCRHLRSITPP
jgi:hypothetical protein